MQESSNLNKTTYFTGLSKCFCVRFLVNSLFFEEFFGLHFFVKYIGGDEAEDGVGAKDPESEELVSSK